MAQHHHHHGRRGSVKASALPGGMTLPFGLSGVDAGGVLAKLKWLAANFKWPLEKMTIGNVTTAWVFQDGWVILAYILLLRPLLVVSYSVCAAIVAPSPGSISLDKAESIDEAGGDSSKGPTWRDRAHDILWNTEGYNSSWSRIIYRPLLLLSVPFAATYIKDVGLNLLFTYKLVKKAQLLNIAAGATEASKIAFLAWAGFSAFYLKDRLIGPVFGKTKAGRMILPALSKLISIAVLTVLAVGALKLFGLDKESLGLAGITAAVTATAGQSFLKQFLASLFMSSPESAIQVGEIVSVGGYLGSVTKVGWMKTTLALPEGFTVYINNETLLRETVTSITRSGYRRMDEMLHVISADPRRVFDAVEELRLWIRSSDISHKNLPVQVHVFGATAHGLKVRLEVPFANTHGRDPGDARARELNGRHAVMKAACDVFAKHQCVIWELKGSAPAQVPTGDRDGDQAFSMTTEEKAKRLSSGIVPPQMP